MAKKIIAILLALSISFTIGFGKADAGQPKTEEQKMDAFIHQYMKKSKIPGLAAVVIKNGKTIYQKGVGYADKEKKRPVTLETRFQLASLTKAFTGLAIMDLVKQGRLSLDDKVAVYLPWFHVTYNGQPVDLTIKELLEQSSGFPSDDFMQLPPSTNRKALQEGIKDLNGFHLSAKPGTTFIYSNINYDILGLILEKITGEPYAKWMKQRVFSPLRLNDTTVKTTTASDHLTKGYKVAFFSAREYDRPANNKLAPAAAIISDSHDMEKWMRLNLDIEQSKGFPFIDQSSGNPYHYFAGWMFGTDQRYHSGHLENNSSYILLNPKENTGIVVMANLNSAYITAIAKGLEAIVHGETPSGNYTDDALHWDRVASIILIGSLPIICLELAWLVTVVTKIRKRRLTFRNFSLSLFVSCMGLVLIVAGAIAIFRYPMRVLSNVPWFYIKDWLPATIYYGTLAVTLLYTLFIIAGTLAILFKPSKK